MPLAGSGGVCCTSHVGFFLWLVASGSA
jgi:hypothetical protein